MISSPKVINQFPHAVEVHENIWISMSDGCRLAAKLWLPVSAAKEPVPAIVEYLPYRKRDGTAERDHLTHPYFAGHGYACLRVDMRGNGEADGVMLDEYTPLEQSDCLELLDWIAGQDWCTGGIGMMGISWGGFNGLQVAAHNPEPLKAIITLCSTDDRYADDIHYKGGCLINENLGWGATMLAYSSRPPDPELVGERWRDMWLERLEAEPFLALDWLIHPHRDDYWRQGSVCEDFSAITAAVLAVGGWNDAYSNAIPRMLNGLSSPVKAIIGPWAHKYPHFAVPGPRIGFLQEALRWWDRWLKGIETGVEADPAVRAYVMDSISPAGALPDHWPGRWIADDAWPGPETQELSFYLSGNALTVEPGDAERVVVNTPQGTGKDSGEFCIIWLGPEMPGDQREDDEGAVTFTSEPLDESIDIVGAATLDLTLRSDRPVASIAARLNDVRPDGTVSRITYTIFNLCHRDSHAEPTALEPGKQYPICIRLDDVARHVPAGHRLRVCLSTTYWPLMWPSPETVTLMLVGNRNRITIPVRTPQARDSEVAFPEAVSAPALKLEELRAGSNSREHGVDADTGKRTLTIVDDFGKYRDLSHGLAAGTIAREWYEIADDDPLSARARTHWTEELERPGWEIRTETFSEMTASAAHFHLSAKIEAYENGKLVFTKSWEESVPRALN